MQISRLIIADRIFAWLGVVLILISWGIALWAWPDLPIRIPTHFGPSGVPDAWSEKNFWSVFLLPIIQVGISALLWWCYRHPQYSNIPSTMVIMALPEPTRSTMFRLIRRMLVITLVLVNLLMAHIVLASVSVAFRVSDRLNPWLMLFFVVILFSILARYTIAMYRIVKKATMNTTFLEHKNKA